MEGGMMSTLSALQSALDLIERDGEAFSKHEDKADKAYRADVIRILSAEIDAQERSLHAAQTRHDIRCKVGSGDYP
jgi:hypothetical protein